MLSTNHTISDARRDCLLAQINTVGNKPLLIPYNTTDGCSKRDIGIG